MICIQHGFKQLILPIHNLEHPEEVQWHSFDIDTHFLQCLNLYLFDCFKGVSPNQDSATSTYEDRYPYLLLSHDGLDLVSRRYDLNYGF